MSVYNPDAFAERVSYAAKCLISGQTDSRAFDTCFEMDDGDAVVTALIRRAESNRDLREALEHLGRQSPAWIEGWRKCAAEHDSEKNLSALARRLRAAADARFREMMKRKVKA